jgi:hypothetical protein
VVSHAHLSPWWPTCVCIFAMFVGLMIARIPDMPRCPFCGKTREHATDCPTKR